MDLATMRGLVRRDLKDEDAANYVWTDDEIDRAIQKAISELDRHVPRSMRNTVATADGSREIDISALTNRISVDKVEFPTGEHPLSFQRFAVYQDTLTLIDSYEGDGENCYIYWSTVHTLDADSSTIPAELETLVALGATAYAVIAQGRYHSDRANIGGQNVDRDYAYWSRDRLKEFKEGLKKASRHNKVRSSVLYAE